MTEFQSSIKKIFKIILQYKNYESNNKKKFSVVPATAIDMLNNVSKFQTDWSNGFFLQLFAPIKKKIVLRKSRKNFNMSFFINIFTYYTIYFTITFLYVCIRKQNKNRIF